MKTTLMPPGALPARETPRIQHTFELTEPADWLRLSVRFGHGGGYVYVADPLGRLRMQALGRRDEVVRLLGRRPGESGCGTVPGPLPAGRWRVLVIAHAKDRPPEYRVDITSGTGDPPEADGLIDPDAAFWTVPEDAAGGSALRIARYDWRKPLRAGRRWYRGDCHMHTVLSDGRQTARQLSEQALSRGLDFIIVTEHNIMTTGWPSSSLLVIPGIEMTASRGHFNALGIREWVDLFGAEEAEGTDFADDADGPGGSDGARDHGDGPADGPAVAGIETGPGMNRALREARRQGAVCSLNHPMLAPWHWQFADTPLDGFDTIELWNDPTYPDNAAATEAALKLWTRLWNDGRTIWGIGGSDTHLLPTESYTEGGPPSLVGDPLTCVLSEELSAAAILEALRSGRCYVTRGPVLEPVLRVGDARHVPGDRIRAEGYGNGDLRPLDMVYELACSGAPEGAVIRWIVDGAVHAVQRCDGDRTYLCPLSWNADEYHWVRVEVRDADQKLLAFVNPIYSGRKSPKLTTWGELLAAEMEDAIE